MKTGIIYKATSPSEKVYIGQTTQALRRRKSAHLCVAFNKNKSMYNTKFSNAIRKYGIESFDWEIICNKISYVQLLELEIQMIAKYDSYHCGYNSTTGGDGRIGAVVSIKTRAKLSKANSGKIHSKETKEKISKSKRGENSPAKLNWAKVVEIRNLQKQGYKYKYISKKYGIAARTVSDVITNRTWKIF